MSGDMFNHKGTPGIKLICRSCSARCMMVYNPENGTLKGNKCPRGEAYARAYDPEAVKVRVYQLPIENGYMNRVAVKTDRSVSNEQADQIEEAVHRLKLKAPVRAGEVLFQNVGGTGVHLIAVRAMRQRI